MHELNYQKHKFRVSVIHTQCLTKLKPSQSPPGGSGFQSWINKKILIFMFHQHPPPCHTHTMSNQIKTRKFAHLGLVLYIRTLKIKSGTKLIIVYSFKRLKKGQLKLCC